MSEASQALKVALAAAEQLPPKLQRRLAQHLLATATQDTGAVMLCLQGRDRVIVARLLAAKYELGEALRLIETPRAPAPAPPAELRLPLGTTMQEIEREAILQVLSAEQGNRSRTAERLNISRRTVGYWLAKALAQGADVPEAPNKPRPAPGDEEDGGADPAMSGT